MPFSIEEMGLEKYLDATKPHHNNLGYKELIKMIEGGAGPVRMAGAFGVSRPTLNKWLKLYNSRDGKHEKS